MAPDQHERRTSRSTRALYNRAIIGVVALVGAALVVPGTAAFGAPQDAATEKPAPQESLATSAEPSLDGALDRVQADEMLGNANSRPSDRAWTLAGQEDGLHVLTAVQEDGYAWSDVALLGVELDSTDRWVGNGCLSSDGYTLAVVYAPATYANDERLFRQGARGALVNLETSEVVDLSGGFTLSYFNPGCGLDQRVALTALEDAGTAVTLLETDHIEGRREFRFAGQVTSAIPYADSVAAARTNKIVTLDSGHAEVMLASTDGQVSSLMPYDVGGLAFVVTDAVSAQAYVKTDESVETAPEALATGALRDLQLVSTHNGGVLIAGANLSESSKLPDGVQLIQADVGTRAYASSDGAILVELTEAHDTDESSVNGEGGQPAIAIDATGIATSVSHEFVLAKELLDAPRTPTSEGAQGGAARRNGLTESPCSVPRNDPSIQAYQPGLEEVEWAVTRAVFGTLEEASGAQAMFPLPAISGGGRVPVQILLGILAQESNLWQASRYTTRGVTGNPLMGDYYGTRSENSTAWWDPSYDDADCGYGIAQVTDGMRAGQQSYNRQLAIATDYKSNIARGLQILIEKWNQTRDAGLVINDGDPQYLENWFYALWAYNTGFYPQAGFEEPWGVGWLNNPVNPIYPPNRESFLQYDASDAANPQDWPYPEKVLGFAANPPWLLSHVTQDNLGDTFEVAPAYEFAWWVTEQNRVDVKPPIDLFCDVTNDCDLTTPVVVDGELSPCAHQYAGSYDLQCWYHQPATWKYCASACGNENLEYSESSPKPPRPATSYHPVCDTFGLPAAAIVVDAVPSDVSQSDNCQTPVSNGGEFRFEFPGVAAGVDDARVDLHQLGTGLNGSFYFTHARDPEFIDEAARLEVKGVWEFQATSNGWGEIYVHMPDHGAWLQQARYVVDTGSSEVSRTLSQRNFANSWLSLGVFDFTAAPVVSLSSTDVDFKDVEDLRDSEDIAWDAVAFVPLPAKPANIVVALGDSYSSGEGTSAHDGSDFYRSSDYGGRPEASNRNACHRSPGAWSLGISMPGDTKSFRQRVDDINDSSVDYHLLACSGAVVRNLLPREDNGTAQYGEVPQLDQGYLDSNTTLVTLTIGGNDIGFAEIINACIMGTDGTGGCGQNVISVAPDGTVTTLSDIVEERLERLDEDISGLLTTIHLRAPQAKILLQGYPSLFENGGTCFVGIADSSRPWLSSVTEELNAAMSTAAFDAGSFVQYQNPQYQFAGHNLCPTRPGSEYINGLIVDLTPGDLGIPSAQSVHPNLDGSLGYGISATQALRSSVHNVAATIVGGAPTTYYSTPRYHGQGTNAISMDLHQFSECGGELRIGLRVAGSGSTQMSETLSWSSPGGLKHFRLIGSPSDERSSYELPSGFYSINSRLVDSCSGVGPQSWSGTLVM